jgi:UDP-GlcNAc3NAcA epimerase
MKVVSIVGTRPQFVKCAAVSRELRKKAKEILVHTGQHYDDKMSDIFFRELSIPTPDYNLEVGSGTHGWQTAQMLTSIEDVLRRETPDWILIYGDTNSTLAAALAGSKLKMKVAHVEAGLRSFNRDMPEEINRVVADHLSSILFCPSKTASQNLAREGITKGVHVVGDVMNEILKIGLQVAERGSDILSRLKLKKAQFILATVHRAENTDNLERLDNILRAFNELRDTVVFPVHPRTRKIIDNLQIPIQPHIQMIEPVGYVDMVMLEKSARLILTDSGGIQKEAYWVGVPCLTLRDETEWVETIESGWNQILGTDPAAIVDAVNTVATPKNQSPLYGDGYTAKKIVDLLLSQYSGPSHRSMNKPPRISTITSD